VRGSRDWVERAFLAKVFPLVAPYLGAAAPRFAEAVAKILLRKGIALVSSVRVVVSDRLHAVIVSTLLGVPRVALDNSYGKVHGFMRTWFDGDPDTALATTVDEARAMADRLSTRSQ
jgi:pyruvyl transferase EpsO